MKYPTAKSLKMKKSSCKKPLNKICNQQKLLRKNLTAKTLAVKNSTKEKVIVKVSRLKAKFLTAIKPMKKSLTLNIQTIMILNKELV